MAETVTPLRPGIGHNQPPEIIDVNDPAILRARLEREYEPLMQRFVELELGAKARLKKPIRTEEDAETVLDWLKGQCDDAVTKAREAHDREMRPFIDCSKAIHEFFLRRIDKFKLAISPVRQRRDAFLLQKKEEQRAIEAEQRRRAREAAEQAAAEQRRLEEEARKSEAAGDRRSAIGFQRQAEQQLKHAEHNTAVAEAPGAPARLHGQHTRATAYIETVWTFEVEDPAALPEGYKMPDEEAIQKAIDRGIRHLAGVRIFEVDVVRDRRC